MGLCMWLAVVILRWDPDVCLVEVPRRFCSDSMPIVLVLQDISYHSWWQCIVPGHHSFFYLSTSVLSCSARSQSCEVLFQILPSHCLTVELFTFNPSPTYSGPIQVQIQRNRSSFILIILFLSWFTSLPWFEWPVSGLVSGNFLNKNPTSVKSNPSLPECGSEKSQLLNFSGSEYYTLSSRDKSMHCLKI